VEEQPGLVASKPPYDVGSFRQLVEIAAQLAYLNKDHLLFYRGQSSDFLTKYGKSSFYPTIYRSDPLLKRELDYRYKILNHACDELSQLFVDRKIEGYKEVKRRKFIQWSLLQHYEVCKTPLLDFTHSLRVACSFALNNNDGTSAFVYVFGLPYITNRITINSEHDLVNIRLLSICPPSALRPYFQEGYLASTDDVTVEYDSKDELDFSNRLIAKFRIPNNPDFWGADFKGIPNTFLYPVQDPIKDLCDEIKERKLTGLYQSSLVDFLKAWSELEKRVVASSRKETHRYLSFGQAQKQLLANNRIDQDYYNALNRLRKYRNTVVHQPEKINNKTLAEYYRLLLDTLNSFDHRKRSED
jgi:hypothetical protein